MAKAAKKSTRTAGPKSGSVPRPLQIEVAPIRLIVEVVMKQEHASTEAFLAGGGAGPEIKYEFKGDNIKVFYITIGDKTVYASPVSGSITLDSMPLNRRVNVFAKLTFSGGIGTGTLQLKYNGKELFQPALPLVFDNNGECVIETTAKL